MFNFSEFLIFIKKSKVYSKALRVTTKGCDRPIVWAYICVSFWIDEKKYDSIYEGEVTQLPLKSMRKLNNHPTTGPSRWSWFWNTVLYWHDFEIQFYIDINTCWVEWFYRELVFWSQNIGIWLKFDGVLLVHRRPSVFLMSLVSVPNSSSPTELLALPTRGIICSQNNECDLNKVVNWVNPQYISKSNFLEGARTQKYVFFLMKKICSFITSSTEEKKKGRVSSFVGSTMVDFRVWRQIKAFHFFVFYEKWPFWIVKTIVCT